MTIGRSDSLPCMCLSLSRNASKWRRLLEALGDRIPSHSPAVTSTPDGCDKEYDRVDFLARKDGSMAFRIDHAEQVALGVREDHEVFTRLLWPVADGAEAKQPFDLSLLVGRVKVEMQSAPFGRHRVDGDVGPLSCGVLQDDERVSGSGRPPRHVAKRRLPERHHSSEVVDVDDDRPNSDRALLHDAQTQLTEITGAERRHRWTAAKSPDSVTEPGDRQVYGRPSAWRAQCSAGRTSARSPRSARSAAPTRSSSSSTPTETIRSSITSARSATSAATRACPSGT